MVGRAHGAALLAIFDPASGDGLALCKAFWPLMKFRAIDAVRHELLHRRRHPELPLDDDGEIVTPAMSMAAAEASSIEVAQRLACIGDPRKRLTFHLFIEGMRIRTGDPCVTRVLGCEAKTAEQWIERARQTLVGAGLGGRHGDDSVARRGHDACHP